MLQAYAVKCIDTLKDWIVLAIGDWTFEKTSKYVQYTTQYNQQNDELKATIVPHSRVNLNLQQWSHENTLTNALLLHTILLPSSVLFYHTCIGALLQS